MLRLRPGVSQSSPIFPPLDRAACLWYTGKVKPVVLTIAGSDSGGGAGIQADLKTFHALGCFGTSAITAVTAQNTRGVRAIQGMTPDIVAAQIEAVLEDFPVGAVKTGMLLNAPIIRAVRRTLAAKARAGLPIIVDPVMVATSGDRLLDLDAEDELRELMKQALLVTPNLDEARVLTKKHLDAEDDLIEGAMELHQETEAAVLFKGGHRPGTEILDIFYDGNEIHRLRSTRIFGPEMHGTGCTLSAAIAAGLAEGRTLHNAILLAREFVRGAIERSFALGAGARPLNHLWQESD